MVWTPVQVQYALTKLGLPETATKNDITKAVFNHLGLKDSECATSGNITWVPATASDKTKPKAKVAESIKKVTQYVYKQGDKFDKAKALLKVKSQLVKDGHSELEIQEILTETGFIEKLDLW